MTVVWTTRHLLFSNIELIVVEVETCDIVKTSMQLAVSQCLTLIIINNYQALTYNFKQEYLTLINAINIHVRVNMQIFTYSDSQIINFLQDIGRSKADETASLHNTSFVGIYQRKMFMMTLQTFICIFQGGISIIVASGFKIELE